MGTTGSKSNTVDQQRLPDQQQAIETTEITNQQVLDKQKLDQKEKENINSISQQVNDNEARIIIDQPKPQHKQKTDLDKRKEYALLGKSDYFKTEKCFHCKSLGIFICEHDTAIRDDMQRYYTKEGSYYKPKPKKIENEDDDLKSNRSNSVVRQYRKKSVNSKKANLKANNNDDDCCSCCFDCCKTT